MASLAIIGKVVLPTVPPGVLVMLRVGGAATVLLAVNRAMGLSGIRDRRDLGHLAVLGLLGVAANQSLFLLGLRYTTAINATLLVASIPVFTVLFSVLLKREPPSGLKLGGIAAAAAGTIYLIGPDRVTLAPKAALGNTLILCGMLAYSLYLIYSKDLAGKYRSVTMSFYVMFFGALGVLPFGIYSLRGADLAAIRPVTWGLVGYIVIFPTLVAYFINIWALKRASPNLVASYIYLQPVLTAVVAPRVLEGEHITARTLIAAAMIFAGLALVIRGELVQHRQVPVNPLTGE